MRRPSYDQSSCARIGGRIFSDVTDVEVQPGRPRKLCRNGFAYEGRAPQAEGFSQRVWRFRRGRFRVKRHRLILDWSRSSEGAQPVTRPAMTLGTPLARFAPLGYHPAARG